MNRTTLNSGMLPVVFLVTFLLCIPCTGGPLEYLRRWMFIRNTESPVVFYGRIIDLDGKPVEGVTVKYSTTTTNPFGPEFLPGETATDANGDYVIKCGKALELFIDDVFKDGYDFHFIPCQNNHGYLFRRDRRDRHHPDKANPVVFTMRKCEDEAVVIIKRGITLKIDTTEENSWHGFDLAQQSSFHLSKKKIKESKGYFWDLEMTGKPDFEQKTWTVTLTANGDQAGILLSNKQLFMTPEEGYQKSITLTLPFMKWKDFPFKFRYIYARLRNPGMYARIDLEDYYCHVTEKECCIRGDAFINPFGDRCLEEGTGFGAPIDSYEECLRLEIHAEEMMSEQKLAERPDFRKMMKEGKFIYKRR